MSNNISKTNSQGSTGRFGVFGGQYVPETLMQALDQLSKEYAVAKLDDEFNHQIEELSKHYVGRPTPLYFAQNLTDFLGGAQIYIKREDLAHTGAHKINNALGQAILAKRMGKTRIIAETGAGQHGVAAATACAMLGFECVVYMGEEDISRQRLNVFRMELLGAEVRPVKSGTRTLKDAINDTHYLIGSVVGPHPYPEMVRDFQTLIGLEAKSQIINRTGGLPNYVVACVGGGSNAIGLFHEFIGDETVKLIGVEAGGFGNKEGEHAATLTLGEIGVLHGSMSYLLQDENGQVSHAHSISAGLDYPGVGPEHSYLKDIGRAQYVSVTDIEAIEGFKLLTRTEGIIPALEPAHAVAYMSKFVPTLSPKSIVLLGLSGRGDKDIESVSEFEANS